MKKIDALTLEIGSTITKANGFCLIGGGLDHVGQGHAASSVDQGDVSIGVLQAIDELEKDCDVSREGAEIFINSSAAGGLKMTVHGLTMSMTSRAAKEASLGAGAIIKHLTAGALDEYDIKDVKKIRPNLILLAGGVDHGEKEITLANAKLLLALCRELKIPLIYAGNSALQSRMKSMAKDHKVELWVAENVFPGVDVLNVVPLRRLIHEAFSKHIIHASGMEKIREFSSNPIIPTPGAVLLATQALAEISGDCLVVDVGGATTDVHSVTDGSLEFRELLVDPEPKAKRTVEGDLGVFVNADSLLELDVQGEWKSQRDNLKRVPESETQIALTRWLAETAVLNAVKRHAGTISNMYTPTGRKKVIKGKDLSAIKYIIGTGGALSKMKEGEKMLRKICIGVGEYLLPPKNAHIIIDKGYLFSAYGTLFSSYPEQVKRSLECLLRG